MSTVEQTTYEAPGEAGSPVELKERYDNFIGGEWVPPTHRRVPREPHPGDRRAVLRGRGLRRPPTSSSRSTPRTRPRTRGASAPPAERAAVAERDRRRDGGEPRDARGRRELGERQAGARDARRRPAAGDRPLPLLRRRGPRRGGPDLRDRQGDLRLPLPRAARRRRADHPVQLPAADGGVEDRPGAGGRQLHGASSRRARRRGRSSSSCEVIGDIVPPGVLNVVNGPGAEIGKALASNKRIAKVAFTGETVTGRLIMHYAAQNLIPSTTELGGKSPNIFFEDVMAADDAFLDKAIEGLVLYAFNKGEVCTCPSRALIQESIYERVHGARAWSGSARSAGRPARPGDDDRGRRSPAASSRRSRATSQIGRDEGAEVLIGGAAPRRSTASWPAATTSSRPCSRATTTCGSSRRRSSAPCSAVTTFKDEAEALAIANDTMYGLGAGVWTRDGAAPSGWAARSRPAACGPTATTSTRPTPRSAATRPPGVGRENHRMMLDHYTQTKCLLVSYDPKPDGVLLGHGGQRSRATPEALEVIERLQGEHGPLAFFQSGGCCDGSAPMCLTARRAPARRRRPEAGRDRRRAVLHRRRAVRALGQPRFVIDVGEGEAGGFSLEGSEGVHFISRAPAGSA